MAYVKIIFQNSPSTATPINAENLNHMDDQIALNDQRLTEIETSYVKSFNGRKGEVVPENGDYDIGQISPLTGAQVGQVPVVTNIGTEEDPELVFRMGEGGGGGDSVSYSQTLSSGTETGEITINGTTTKMYAPTQPTKVSDLSNDSGFITNIVNNLTNYYKKSETYTQSEINNLIAAINAMKIAFVQALPTTDIDAHTIYFVPKQTPQTEDSYDEYINTDGTTSGWEHIGSTSIDLSNYYTKAQVDTLLADKADNAPTFTEASTRSNIASGETISTLFGKIMKFFTDLKAVAFSGSASDVTYDTSHSVEDNFKNIEIIIPPNITNYAAYKNAGGNRGENITEYWKDGSLADRIDGVNGFKPFEDLYLWDYIDLDSNITAPSSGGGTVTGTRRIHIGEFNGLNNYQLNKRTDNVNFFNHLRMVTGTHFGMSKMNDTNTTEGGYLGSKMHTDIIGDISTSGTLAKQLYDQLGSLLVPTTELLTNSINASGYNRFGTNSGCSNNWTWADVYARLLSEIESNGSIVWSSSGYDTGNAQHQLPAFKNDKAAAYPQGIYYWSKDIATSMHFCNSDGHSGDADYDGAFRVDYVRLLLTLGRKPS